jgi:hypothetical protein
MKIETDAREDLFCVEIGGEMKEHFGIPLADALIAARNRIGLGSKTVCIYRLFAVCSADDKD